jgi:hypothetical protein
MEKLRCMRRNRVQRGLDLELEVVVEHFRHYVYGERGPVLVNQTRKAELHIRRISLIPPAARPTRETATGGASCSR